MSDREERIEALARSIIEYMADEGTRCRYGPDCDKCRKSAEGALRKFAPFLESSPAPDEVAVAAKRLVDTIDGMQKGAEKMGGQWYFPDLVLEDRDALRAALNEQDRASLPKGKEDGK